MKNERFANLLADTSGLISYVCDPETYELLYMTNTAMETFGLTSSEQYEGKKCYQILHGKDSPCSNCTSRKLSEGKFYKWEYYNTLVSRWLDITDTLASMDGKQYKVSTARDITARKDINAPLSEKASAEDVLFRCLHVLATEKDLHRALHMLLAYVGEYYKADRTHIFEIDKATQTFSSTSE